MRLTQGVSRIQAKVDTAVSDARVALGLAGTKPAGCVGGEGRVVGNAAGGNPWERRSSCRIAR
jgi:hypothetical protein